MSFLNGLLRSAADIVLIPFRDFAPIVGITVLSLVAAIFILFVYKHTSNQKALDNVKRKIHAGLFEIRLYNDDFRSIVGALFDILRANLTYMRHSFRPMLWTLPPMFLLIAQFQFLYGYEGLRPDQPALLKVLFEPGAFSGDKPALEVTTPAGLRVDEPFVWIPSLGEATWRLHAEAPGDYELTIGIGTETATKSVRVADGVARRSPFRIKGFLNELLFPAEAPLPSGGAFAEITVTYAETNVNVFGFEMHLIIVFFVLSVVFAFALRGSFGVTF